MRSIDPKVIATKDLHQFIVGSIAPRPIAFVSTIAEDGTANLAPYSFFNAFSSNPPILVFSSNRRVSNNTTKDTLANVQANGEVVINVVNHAIVHQMAVTSVEFDSSISEFEKAGLTPIASETIRPFRVKESPVQYECKVKDIITLGEHGGAGHLVICEVIKLHISEDVIDERNRIDPQKLDLMGRMGRAYYVRASGDAIQTIVQSVIDPAIGFDALPKSIQQSAILTGNDLGKLAGLPKTPDTESVRQYLEKHAEIRAVLKEKEHPIPLHQLIQQKLLERTGLEEAALMAWCAEV